jgi:diguanylate cyclase (GGDEF)-like protein
MPGIFDDIFAPYRQSSPPEDPFMSWYSSRASRLGLDPDPDSPLQRYDYRGAFAAGAEPDADGHWPSQFKAPDHPNRFVEGEDTMTGGQAPIGFGDIFAPYKTAMPTPQEQKLAELKAAQTGGQAQWDTIQREQDGGYGSSLMSGIAGLPALAAGVVEGIAENPIPRADSPLPFDFSPIEEIAGPAREMRHDSQANAAALMPQDPNLVQKALASVPTTAAILAGTAINPALGASLGAGASFGSAYGERRDRGVAPGEAFLSAAPEAAVIGGLESIGAGSVLGKAWAAGGPKAAAQLIFRIGKGAAGEGLTEGAQELVSIASEASTGKYASLEELWQDVKARVPESAAVGALLGAPGAAVSSGVQAARERQPAPNLFADVFQAPEEVIPEAPPAAQELAGAPISPKLPQIPVPEEFAPPADPLAAPQMPRRLAEMSREELLQVATQHPVTGLPNRRAFFEGEAKPITVSSDIDSLKWANDTFGHEAGDALLKKKAAIAKELGIDLHHFGGDEFAARFESEDEADAKMEELKARLLADPLVFQTPDGQTVELPVSFTYAAHQDYDSADALLGRAKELRTQLGQRAARGEPPPTLVRQGEVPPPGVEVPRVQERSPEEAQRVALEYLGGGIKSPESEFKPIPEGRKPTAWSGKVSGQEPYYSTKSELGPIHQASDGSFTLLGMPDKGKTDVQNSLGPPTEIMVEEITRARRNFQSLRDSGVLHPVETRGIKGSGTSAILSLSNGRELPAKYLDYIQRKLPNAEWLGQTGMSSVYLVQGGEIVGIVHTDGKGGKFKDLDTGEEEETVDPASGWAALASAPGSPVSQVERGEKWSKEPPKQGQKWFAQALPELVDLSKRILGSTPRVKKNLPGMLGVFRPTRGGEGKIELLASHAKDTAEFARTLAHEIGHAVDWMDSKEMDRGNILGRLAVLKKFFQSVIGGTPAQNVQPLTKVEKLDLMKKARASVATGGDKKARAKAIASTYRDLLQKGYEAAGGLTKKDAMREMIEVSKAMRPAQWEGGGSPYSKSSVELYADAFSMLMVNPEEYERLAPKSSAAWKAYLERKPEVKSVLDELMQRSEAGRDAVLENREGIRLASQAEGRAAQLQGMLPEQQTLKERIVESKETAAMAFLDRNNAIYQLRKKAKKIGGTAAQATKRATRLVEELAFNNAEAAAMLSDTSRLLLDPLRKAGVQLEDVSDMLFLRRAGGERGSMANPLGYDPEAAFEGMQKIHERLGDAKFQAVEEGLWQWWKQVREPLLLRLQESGAVSDELLGKMLSNPDYARFEVTKYIDKAGAGGTGWGASFKEQFGTFEGIGDPLLATIIRDMGIMRLAHRTKTAQAVEDAAKAMGVWEAAETTFDRNAFSNTPVEPKDRKLGLVTYMQSGKLVGYYVPKSLAAIFEKDSDQIGKVGRFISSGLLNNPLRGIYVVFNPVFAARNLVRDVQSFIKNVPGFHPVILSRAYYQAAKELAPIAVKHVLHGDPSFTQAEMEARMHRAIVTPGKMILQAPDASFDSAFEVFASRSGYTDSTHLRSVRKPLAKAFDHLQMILTTPTEFTERLTKVAGWKYTAETMAGKPIEERAEMVRNRIGTPNSYRRGTMFALYNNVSLFSNIAKEGWRSSWDSFKDDKAGYTAKVVAMDVLPALLGAVLASGLLDGDDEDKKWSEIWKRLSEYDKSSSTIVPFGITAGGKAVVLRLPHDHIGGFTHALAFKAFASMLADEEEKSSAQGAPTQALKLLMGQIPFTSAAPMLESYGMIAGFAVGKNPYDNFRGKLVLTERELQAHDWDSWKKVLKSAWNNAASGLVTFQTDTIRSVQGEVREVLGFSAEPEAKIWERFLHVTDRGIFEREQAKESAAEQEKARASVALDKAIAAELKTPQTTAWEVLKALRTKNIDTGERFSTAFDRVHEKLYGAKVPQSKR